MAMKRTSHLSPATCTPLFGCRACKRSIKFPLCTYVFHFNGVILYTSHILRLLCGRGFEHISHFDFVRLVRGSFWSSSSLNKPPRKLNILVTHVVILSPFFLFVPLCRVDPDFVSIVSLNLVFTQPWTGTGSGFRASGLRYWYSWVTWPQRWKCLLIVSAVLINVAFYQHIKRE